MLRFGTHTKPTGTGIDVKPKLYLVTSFADECEIEVVKDAFCEKGRCYLMSDKSRPIIEHLKTVYETEKQMNEWIRKYDNAMNGLRYWKERAESASDVSMITRTGIDN